MAWGQDLIEQVQEAARSTQPPLQVEVERRRGDDRDVASIQVGTLARGWVQTSDGRLLVPLVNAVGRRDYSLRGAAVEVRLYDDAVEVESPGTLAGYVTVENLREAQYSRNERIMDGLQRLGLVEEAGQGIDRMIAEMEDALLDPPEFEERSASFVVRLRGGSVFAAEDRLWISQFGPPDLDTDAKVALVFARRMGAITNEQRWESSSWPSSIMRAGPVSW